MTTCFVAGIVKGLVEANDPTRHFGSLLALQSHIEDAKSCGMVHDDGCGKVTITEKGRQWYTEKKMAELPPVSRAYMWSLERQVDWAVPDVDEAHAGDDR